MEALIGCFAILGFFAVLPFLIIYDVWAWSHVLVTLWAWFAVPAWHVDQINVQQAIAIGVLFAIFRVRASASSSVKKDKDGNTDWAAFGGTMFAAMLAPWLTLGCMWFIKIVFM